MQQTRPAPAAMIERVTTVLHAFVGQPPLTLVEVARRSQLPASSTHRILQHLVGLGWVERSGFEYALGIKMFELGSHVMRQRGICEAALPLMTRLHRQTGCTSYLSVLIGSEILHVERVGLGPQAGPAWDVGSRQSLVLTAPGRAMLAALPRDEWPELTFGASPTRCSVQSQRQLDKELVRIRERGGVAVDTQGCAVGVSVVAAPINLYDERGMVALSLCGPTKSINLEAAAAAVRAAAAEIAYAKAGLAELRDRGCRPLSAAALR